MLVPPNGFEHLLQGEPTPEALFREEYLAGKRQDDDDHEDEVVDPGLRRRAALLRAQVTAGVGKFFA
jgi:hypothetical protein